MNSNASPDEEYGPMEFDQMIQDEFFDSSNSNKVVDIIMLMSMQEKMDRQVQHILNFKGSIKGRRVINRDRVLMYTTQLYSCRHVLSLQSFVGQ